MNMSQIMANKSLNAFAGSPLESTTFDNYDYANVSMLNDEGLIWFREMYLVVHGYISLVVCTFGIIANIANIIVLTRKEMVSPTNAILTGLAAADMLVMADYVPFAAHNYVHPSPNVHELYTYGWAVYALFHAHLSVVCHTISTWLTVLLAVWRYIAVSYPTESKLWCSMRRTGWAILGTYVVVTIFCIPVYLSFTITSSSTDDGYVIYRVDWSQIATDNGELLKRINFWVFSVGTKLVPCILLTYLSLTLIRALIEADKRRRRLRCSPMPASSATPRSSASIPATNTTAPLTAPHTHIPVPPPAPRPIRPTTSSPSDRTTKMLVAVLLLFLLTEFPSGILVLLSVFIGDSFFKQVYMPLGELLDILALTNSAINFILYCTMSSAFRATFMELFCFKPTDPQLRARRRASGVELPTTVITEYPNHNPMVTTTMFSESNTETRPTAV